jgi:putative hydrolase of the HAD superfamily
LSHTKGVLFDLVGTLMTVRGSVGCQYATMASSFGIEAEPAALDAAFRAASKSAPPILYDGRSLQRAELEERKWWRALVGEVFERGGAGPAAGERFDAFFDTLFRHFASASAWQVYDDVLPALELMKSRGMGCGLVTNFDMRVYSLLESTGLAPFFPVVVIPAAVGCSKPDARIFAAALLSLGLLPEEAAHVGDSLDNDVRVAESLGMKAVWLDRRDRPAAPGVLRVRSLAGLPWLADR